MLITAVKLWNTQAFVDSMVFSRTLLHCQKKLKDGAAPDSGIILGWARQFQVGLRSPRLIDMD